jgi:hypothetical protein
MTIRSKVLSVERVYHDQLGYDNIVRFTYFPTPIKRAVVWLTAESIEDRRIYAVIECPVAGEGWSIDWYWLRFYDQYGTVLHAEGWNPRS